MVGWLQVHGLSTRVVKHLTSTSTCAVTCCPSSLRGCDACGVESAGTAALALPAADAADAVAARAALMFTCKA